MTHTGNTFNTPCFIGIFRINDVVTSFKFTDQKRTILTNFVSHDFYENPVNLSSPRSPEPPEL